LEAQAAPKLLIERRNQCKAKGSSSTILADIPRAARNMVLNCRPTAVIPALANPAAWIGSAPWL
jgi:hypothetical protein